MIKNKGIVRRIEIDKDFRLLWVDSMILSNKKIKRNIFRSLEPFDATLLAELYKRRKEWLNWQKKNTQILSK